MTVEIAILLAILTVMAYLFFTEKLPIEITAFAGLIACTLGGYIEADEAFTGFASPAVITMLSVFFLSAALLHTGVADQVGGAVQRWLGGREIPLLVAIMLVAALLSAFMNNIAAVAVLMPAVGSIARRTGVPPSRLFMPLSYGAILGGTTTLVGTPPNILAGDMLRERGLEPFGLFEFTPLGLVLLVAGLAFMVVFGRRLLPAGGVARVPEPRRELVEVYRLQDKLFSIRIPEESRLVGMSLRETRFGAALGLQVVSISREGRTLSAPDANTLLQGGDVLVVKGSRSRFEALLPVSGVELRAAAPDEFDVGAKLAGGRVLRVREGSPMVGGTIRDHRFRERHRGLVVGIRRGGELLDGEVASVPLQAGDELLIVTEAAPDRQGSDELFEEESAVESTLHILEGRLFVLHVPEASGLAGRTIGASRMGELTGLTVVGLVRSGQTRLGVEADEVIEVGDELLVIGEADRIRASLSLGGVELRDEVGAGLASDEVGMVEAVVAPRSRSAGKTLRDLRFREKFGLTALAIWREGRPIRTGVSKRPLRFGDALLVQGPWAKLRLLGLDPDFLVLESTAQEPRRTRRAPVALGGLALMVAFVVTGFQPIHVAAFTAATFVVIARAITIEEAYRAVEWRAVFLVACILPMGMALERTGAAELLSQTVTNVAGPLGAHAVLASLIVLSSLLSQALDGAPAVVLLTPVALQTAAQLGLSPYPIMMGIALAASAAFMTPFSHKANLLVMGAGGYRFADYLRVGTPLTVVYVALLILLVPVFFPLT